MGFPLHFVSRILCTHDGAALAPAPDCQLDPSGNSILSGGLRCTSCAARFEFDGGILNMMGTATLDNESAHERSVRDTEAAEQSAAIESLAWQQNDHEMMEVIPTLESLRLAPGSTVLELGCGDGRLTVHIAKLCGSVMAVDFSIGALRILQRRLPNASHIGLVLGDVTTLRLGSGFDRVLAWPVSNLPTREHRRAMYRVAASAVHPDGRVVFSMHHFGFWQRLKGEPKSGRYSGNGVYRYIFTMRECRAEVRPHFRTVDVRPVQIYVPFARRLGLPILRLSRMLERVPLINRFGALVVCTAQRPILSD